MIHIFLVKARLSVLENLVEVLVLWLRVITSQFETTLLKSFGLRWNDINLISIPSRTPPLSYQRRLCPIPQVCRGYPAPGGASAR